MIIKWIVWLFNIKDCGKVNLLQYFNVTLVSLVTRTFSSSKHTVNSPVTSYHRFHISYQETEYLRKYQYGNTKWVSAEKSHSEPVSHTYKRLSSSLVMAKTVLVSQHINETCDLGIYWFGSTAPSILLPPEFSRIHTS